MPIAIQIVIYRYTEIAIPIADLTVQCNTLKWVAKGKVVKIEPLRNYKNCKGEGKIFAATFADGSGEIRCVAFHNAADAFSAQLEIIFCSPLTFRTNQTRIMNFFSFLVPVKQNLRVSGDENS